MPSSSGVPATTRLPNLTDPGTVRSLLRLFQLQPRRAQGQTFLTDSDVVHQMVQAGQVTRQDIVLEIGPGLGAVTAELVQHAGHVVAVELDERLFAILKQTFAPWPFPNYTFVRGDALRVPLEGLVAEVHTAHPDLTPYKIIASIPYSITGRLIRRFFATTPRPTTTILLMQREVAERLVARPPHMSRLSVAVQAYGTPTLIATVPAHSFTPVPRVQSAIVRIVTLPQPRFGTLPPDRFFRVVRAGFSQRRKKLLNALAGGLAVPREQAEALLAAAHVSPDQRAQHLTVADWVRLAEAYPHLLSP